MRMLAFQLDAKTAIALAVAGALTIGACAAAQPSARGAECAAIRKFYDDAQSKLIESGACDASPNVQACVPHVALREAFIKSLESNECPSAAK